MPATGRSCWPTARSKASSAGTARRARSGPPRSARSASGESLLLRVLPEDEDAFPESPGASVVVNPCLSGGALEIYLEPLLPPPAAAPRRDVADRRGGRRPRGRPRLRRATGRRSGADPTGATLSWSSSHGGDEAGRSGPRSTPASASSGVVCSRTRGRGAAGRAGPADDEARRASTRTSGVDIGARTAPEVALSIMAAVVRSIRLEGLDAAPSGDRRRRTGRRPSTRSAA